MKRLCRYALPAAVLSLVLASAACEDATAPVPSVEPPSLARAPVPAQRATLVDGIAHYTYDLTVGPGPFDVIRLHRVVKERRVSDPARSDNAVFLLPGAPNSFEGIFLQPAISAAPPRDQSVAIFLAQNDVDVWGMDYAWGLVPPETTEFGFMAGWGLDRDVALAHQAIAAARSIRVGTGQGNGRLDVLGFSYGVMVAWTLAGEETQLPPGRRGIKGIISVDFDYKLEDPAQRIAPCNSVVNRTNLIEAGTYVDAQGATLHRIAELAETDPDGASPFHPALTNWQFAMFAGASGFFVGEFDAAGVPVGLRYTDPQVYLDLVHATPYYNPQGIIVDLSAIRCSEDSPFDDHLGEITLPILVVGAEGGRAPANDYAVSLTASTDYELLTVPGLGHADLFTSPDASALFWRPVLDWLQAQRANRTYP